MPIQKNHNQLGFSLIELMVVISIIGTIVAISSPIISGFVARAKEQEGSLNTRSLYTLVHTYYVQDENPGFPTGAGSGTFHVSINNYTSETSCFAANPLGFSVTDCRKINFFYNYTLWGAMRSISANAFEGGTVGDKRIYPKCCGSSIWITNAGGTYNSATPSKTPICGSSASSYFYSKVGTADPSLDFDGSGTVTSADSSGMSGAMALPAFANGGNQMNHLSSCP